MAYCCHVWGVQRYASANGMMICIQAYAYDDRLFTRLIRLHTVGPYDWFMRAGSAGNAARHAPINLSSQEEHITRCIAAHA